ncbi:TPA: competence/damage-inducible protein A [Streptococcus agalactiae]|uniref:Putative competence-damage inducible protein n=5 Tax=Streptococcus agalactiae TaxID=1311 RepID=CINA_STRA3|nr:competence/damage-inducible protein A [Streptococcus agalactiae]Q8E2R9.1 RecName: Full=Putative competence-damage inducible protein [Streptococcus agalactiae NEM316]ASA99859.1 competence/damage-inducible protein A [Streptococcus agalactiae]EPT50647.1 damage-inducible protein A [Streptococcus agalactiae FSL F2-343]EPU24302.1 damage-inducible protein A [Streptococcus agalactiae LMG 14838]EPV06989.1 damage-inducible protein A [Streptococcus agalactiae GB00548]EPV59616.1 damage-inducible prote
MRAEIIAVGTEILTGQIVNTNAQFLSEKMAELGIDIYFQTAVGDNEERLLSLLDIASQRSQLVILCGGLGPTEDDLTKQTLAKFLGKSLTVDLLASRKLDRFFASRPQFARTPNNERQAQLVEGSIPLQNLTGLAVGGIVTSKGVQYMVLPGPPSELKPMVMEQVVPILSNNGTKLYSRVLRFFGIGESQLVTILEDIIKNQTDPTIAPYAKVGEVTLRLSTKAENQDEADFKLDSLEKEILALKTLDNRKLKDLLYGYGDNNSMARTVLELLKVQNKTITAAESLTAGLFQSQLAEFSGASQVFNGGFTTYSMEAKSQLLGIPKKKLQEYGVVSHFTAEAMAQQARQLLKADFGIGLTGVAGPDELEGYPAGTVFIGIATPEGVSSIKVSIGGKSRSDVRHISTLHAFDLVRRALLKI